MIMKAQLNFDLDDNDDALAHLRAIKALDLCMILWDFDQWLRNEIKHKNKDYQDVRDELCRIMEEYDINLDKLIT